ncbi:MAG: glutaredoxin family protein [Rhodocyclaceae bacterium]|nr:MAG: glutaredoxin family protein [Rhodocyclaceae bacterium]
MRTLTPIALLARSAVLAALCLSTLAAQAQATYRWVGKDGKVHYSDQPPPPAEIKEVQRKKLGPANVVGTSGPGYDAQVAAKKSPLTLYTSANCIQNCKIARDFLNRRGATFAEKEIKTQEDADDFRKATGIEELSVPVLQAGSKSEKGYEENAWSALLDAAGYPRGQDKTPPR